MVKQKENQRIQSIISISNPEIKGSRFSMIIIFLALIRCILEPFRLQYFNSSGLSFSEIKVFLLGALTAAIALLVMTLFSFYGKYKFIIATAAMTILILLIEKFYFEI